MPFGKLQMQLEIAILSEVSRKRKTDIQDPYM